MDHSEIDFKKTIPIWWAFAWRAVLFSTLAGFILGFLVGFIVGISGGTLEQIIWLATFFAE